MTLTNHHSEHEVNQMFTRLASRYDLMNDVVSLGTQRQWRKKFFRQLPVFEGADSLDLCCGTADLTIKLAQLAGPRGRTVGLDFNAAMLAGGEAKIRQADLSKDIELVQGDAMSLPFGDNQFDFVTIGFGLRNVPDANQVLKEAARVLKPGGYFACIEMSQPTNPVVRLGWKAYFNAFPLLAKVFGGSYQDYTYLKETSMQFVSASKLKQMMEEAGMIDVKVTPLNFGAAAIHVGKKALPSMVRW